MSKEEIDKQEDYVNVLRFKRQILHNELFEAQREYDKISRTLKEAQSQLELMLDPSKNLKELYV